MVASNCKLNWCFASRWRERRIVLSSGSLSSPMSSAAISRNIGVSYGGLSTIEMESIAGARNERRLHH